jgi:8-oxo-dGTP diphosphatase
MLKVRFYDPLFEPHEKMTYSVISARFGDKWIFVRHRDRETFEIPGGHIEEEETPYEAASRELIEETGSISFDLQCVSTYCVEKDGRTGYGRLFFAEVTEMGEINDKSEIDELIFSDDLPETLTYPDIQPLLFKKIIEFLGSRET